MNDDQPEITEGDADTPAVDYAAKKRRIVLMLLAYSAILGVISCFLPEEDTPLDFIVALPLLILGISWCFTDAGERDHRIGRLMKLVLVLLFIVGFPIYVFQTRGVRGFKIFVLTLLLVGGMIACVFATAFATLYLGDAIGLWEFVE